MDVFKTAIGLGERMDDLLIRGATVMDGPEARHDSLMSPSVTDEYRR